MLGDRYQDQVVSVVIIFLVSPPQFQHQLVIMQYVDAPGRADTVCGRESRNRQRAHLSHLKMLYTADLVCWRSRNGVFMTSHPVSVSSGGGGGGAAIVSGIGRRSSIVLTYYPCKINGSSPT
jgi:hypothetical protein